VGETERGCPFVVNVTTSCLCRAGLVLLAALFMAPCGRAEDDILSPDEISFRNERRQPERRLRRPGTSQLEPMLAAEPAPAPVVANDLPRVFSITELMGSLLEKNFEIRSQRHAINAAHRALQNAKAQQLPIATLRSNYRDTNFDKRFDDVGDAFGIVIPPGTSGNPFREVFGDIFDAHALITGVSVKVPVYHGDQLAALPRAARAKEALEIVRKERLIQDLLLRLIDLYVDLLFEQKRLELGQEKLAKKEEDLKIARQRIKNDIELRQKQMAVELDIDEIQQEILEIQNNIVLAKEQLTRLAGIPKDISYALRPGITMKDLNLPIGDILREARRTNPSIVAGMKAVDVANQQLAVLKGKDHTTLDLQFDYDEHLAVRNNDRSASVYLASLVFQWDVYDGGRNLSEQKEGEEKREQVIADLETLVQGIEVQVRQSYNKYVENKKQLERSLRTIEFARENLRIIQEKTDAAILLPVDLQEAKVNLKKAEVNRDRALNQIIKSRARLYHLLGKLMPNVFS
jgi:outer membrane protein